MLTTAQKAQIVHELNRAIQHVTDDPAPSPAWQEAPEWQRTSSIQSVQHVEDGVTPEELHVDWMTSKFADGWVWGPVKDADAKTHPCLVPYAELPPEQQLKDRAMVAVVHAMRELT